MLRIEDGQLQMAEVRQDVHPEQTVVVGACVLRCAGNSPRFIESSTS
jgi:hypothetical protein